MKLVSFSPAGAAEVRVGALAGEHVVDFSAAGVEPWHDMVAFLEAGEQALDAARQAVANPPEQALVPLGEVRLRAPVPCPRKLFALAGNYYEHIKESRLAASTAKSSTPRVFMKPPSTTVCGPEDPVVISRYARAVDWEAELAVVVGKRCKYVPRGRAEEVIAGYTALNDVSERRLQVWEREETQEWDRFFDWLNGKWLDGFAPMGPCLVTPEEMPDLSQVRIQLRVNGEKKQDARAGQMILDVGAIIEYISAIVTLEPGDVISTGTPSGVGMASETFLKPGDVMEVEIEGIGVLRNPVVAEE